MIAPGLDLPVCPVVAWHRSHDPHVFSCGLPAGHDGDHGQEVRPGVWMNWTVTMGFASAPPANPADTPAATDPVHDPDALVASGGWSQPSSQSYDFNAIPVEHRHHGHEPGDWYWACCACNGLYDPGCPACAREAGRLDPPVPAAPKPEPFDRSREKFFTGVCVAPGCHGELTGRSLDGADPYWWHSLEVLDNDHEADPGRR